MKIELHKVGKKFRKDWIFRNLDLELKNGEAVAVLGPNGSGKSTLLKILSGMMLPTEGDVHYHGANGRIEADTVYKEVSYAAPYALLFEQLTATEIINLHRKFKSFYDDMDTERLLEKLMLSEHGQRAVREFSSGMKQRLRLGLAILSKTDLLILDEPLTNLDATGKSWYKDLTQKYAQERTVVVGSNSQEDEFAFCSRSISL